MPAVSDPNIDKVSYFNPTGESVVRHIDGKDAVSVKTYVVEHSMRDGEVTNPDFIKLYKKIFNENSGEFHFRLNLEDLPAFDSDELSWEELDKILSEQLEPLYGFVDESLDNGYAFGFHVHGKKHIDEVCKRVIGILGKTITTDNPAEKQRILKRAVVATRIHDLGNMLSRKDHPGISVEVGRTLFGEYFEKFAQDWGIIEQAVNNHEGKAVSAILKDLAEEYGGDTEMIYSEMRKRYGPELWALVIADKTDMGIHRISSKVKGEDYSKAVQGDKPIAKDSLGETKDFMVEDGVVYWDVGFSLSDKESMAVIKARSEEVRLDLGKEEGYDLYENMQTMWENAFLKLDEDRIPVVAISAFALFPEVKRFVLRVSGKEKISIERGIEVSRIMNWRREVGEEREKTEA
jgi:hypothetical protein